MELDALDRRLLALLQQDATRTLYELGEMVALSPSAVQRRITRHRKSGLIAGQVVVLDPDKAGMMLAGVLVALSRESSQLHAEFRTKLLAAPQVQQCYDLAGDWDYLVILATTGMSHCRQLVDELFLDAPNIKRFTTLPVFDVIKSGLELPIS